MGRTKRTRNRRNKTENIVECLDHTDLYQALHSIGWDNHMELRISSFPLTGNGLYSRNAVRAGQCIISLPFDSLISLKSIEQDQAFKEWFITKDLNELPKGVVQFQSLLAFYLCYHLLKENSNLRPYLNCLPKQFSVPYFCSKDEMVYLPDIVLRKMVSQNNVIKDNFSKLQNLVKTAIQSHVCLDLFKWAYFVVNTRSVYLDPKFLSRHLDKTFQKMLCDESSMALAPFLDFFNHNNHTKTTSKLSKSYDLLVKLQDKNEQVDLCYELISETSFAPYSQIFISYGVYNSTQLVTEYGFFLPDNPHEYLEITLDELNAFIRHDPELRPLKIHREKYCFIADHNLNEQLFFVPGDLLSHNLVVCLTILLVEQNIYRLRTVAFGEMPALDPIKSIAHRLVNYKLNEYSVLRNGLSKLSSPTLGGKTALAYLDECINFLNKIRAEL